MNASPSSPAVEVMAPAGSFESLAAALRAGADSVYFGVGKLNMRAHAAANFQEKDLPKIVRLCHACHARAYLTCNIVVYDEEADMLDELLAAAKAAGVDAVIAADMAVVCKARAMGIPVHLSVQANVCNTDALKFYAAYADVIVLARELSLSRIRRIADAIRRDKICGPGGSPVRLELFAHGALCIGISGRCGMSLAAHNKSANRGECYQLCRRRYRAVDAETGFELELDNQYIMSPKDLCTIRVVDQLLDAGVSVLKLEGRGRSESYVSTVTAVYKEAVRAWKAGEWTAEKVQVWEERLRRVFNRDFWHGGYYLGEPWEIWSGSAGSRSPEKREHLGRVLRFFSQPGVAEIAVEAESLSVGAQIEIAGRTTGVLRHRVETMRCDDEKGDAQAAHTVLKGGKALIPLPQKVRRGDKVFLVTARQLG